MRMDKSSGAKARSILDVPRGAEAPLFDDATSVREVSAAAKVPVIVHHVRHRWKRCPDTNRAFTKGRHISADCGCGLPAHFVFLISSRIGIVPAFFSQTSCHRFAHPVQ